MKHDASHTHTVSGRTSDINHLYIFAAFLAFCLFVYSSVYQFQYTFADGTFLIRTYRNFAHFDYVQGRPFQWYGFEVTAWLYFKIGPDAFTYGRGFAVFGFAVWAFLLFLWLTKWETNKLAAAMLAGLATTLTSVQVIAGNVFWFVVPLILVTSAPLLLWNLPEKLPLRIAKIGLAAAFLIFSLGYYQAYILVPVAMLCVPVIYNQNFGELLPKQDGRAILRVVVWTIIAVIIYYVIWRVLLGLKSPAKITSYHPNTLFVSVLGNIIHFFTHRLMTVTALWFGHYKGGGGAGALAFSFIGALIFDVATMRRQGAVDVAASIKLMFPRYLSLAGLFLASDILFFLVVKFSKNSTATGIQLSTLFIHWNFLISLVRAVYQWRPNLKPSRFLVPTLSSLAVVGGLVANHNVLFYIVLNTTLEQRFVANAIRQHLITKGPIERIEISMAPLNHSPFYPGTLEFSWRNSDHDGYLYMTVRLGLCELGQEDNMHITIIPRPDGSRSAQKPLTKKASYKCGPPNRIIKVKTEEDGSPIKPSVLKIDMAQLDNKWSDYARPSEAFSPNLYVKLRY